MAIQATKEIANMLVHLESDQGKGSIAVSNVGSPDQIISATGFHYTFDEALDLFYTIENTKDVHNLFDKGE